MARVLKDKVIIITGASSGIGRATAHACAEAGMDTVLNARREDRLNEVAKEVESRGQRSVLVVGDVTDEGISERMLDAAEQEFGRFDAVFANAGYGADKAMLEMSTDEVREMFDVNFFASADLVQQAARRLVDAGRPGHLLMCASCLAKFTLPRHGCYSATKASQNHICRAMRLELAPHNIEVSCVLPITTTTEFFTVAAEKSGRKVDGMIVPGHTPGMFRQTPQQVARAIVKCLRRPKAEVWTSFPMRMISGAISTFPGMADFLMKRYVAGKKTKRSHAESD